MTTGNKNPGNFANDREKASEAGKKKVDKRPAVTSPTIAKRRQKPVRKAANTAMAVDVTPD